MLNQAIYEEMAAVMHGRFNISASFGQVVQQIFDLTVLHGKGVTLFNHETLLGL